MQTMNTARKNVVVFRKIPKDPLGRTDIVALMAELATDNLLRVLDGELAVAAFDLSKA